ncbi:MAG: P1 family peptidase [Syntrophomonadaceae bacterium]|jgi:L-aminopeptidase/D-esterase-like protein
MAHSITDVNGIKVGCAEDLDALTGCTVVLTGKEGAVCGVDVRGGAPGTRETNLLSPLCRIDRVHAVLLTGGSAFGLDAAGGVMDFLEERGIGHFVGPTVVPIVPAAVIYDLDVGDYKTRPDRKMGYLACQNAQKNVKEGNYGAGAGATVGKIRGYEYCTKSGLGTWSITLESGLAVGAVVAVNAFGDVIEPSTGRVIAGARGDKGQFLGTFEVWKQKYTNMPLYDVTNTTVAVVACNAKLDKAQANKVAQMAHNGLAKTISPVHTMFDGDTVFALATGEIEADVNIVGFLAGEVLARAVIRAVLAAETVKGYRSVKD